MKSSITALFAIVLTLFSISIFYAQPSGVEILWEKSVHVNTMEFNPDGSLLITGGKNTEINCYPYTCGQIKIWDVADSTLLYSVGNFSMGLPNDIDITNDGQEFISGNGSVYCSAFSGCTRDRAGQFEFTINGAQLFSNTNPDGIIYSIAYSPDNSIIAAGTGYNNSGHINIYDQQYNWLRTLPGHSARTTSLIFTHDGQYLISGGYDGYIRVWDYDSGNIVTYFQHGTYLSGGNDLKLSLSADGQYLASTGDGYELKIKIWRTSDWSLVHSFDASNTYGSRSAAEFSPNGLYLACWVSATSENGVIRFYEVETGELVREYIDYSGEAINSIALSSTANNYFAYSVGYGNNSLLRIASTDLNLVENGTIPVEFTSFTSSVNGSTVQLLWTTSTETNNSGFEIQRKESSDWERIGFVEGHGTTTEEQSYSFDDKNLSAGKYQYRLKQIDYDGSFEYSDIVEVEITTPSEFTLEQNYPNPFNPTTTIKYSIPESGNVELLIYNALGEQISTLVNELKDAGRYELEFNADDIPSGIYYYQIKTEGFVQTKKMLLIK